MNVRASAICNPMYTRPLVLALVFLAVSQSRSSWGQFIPLNLEQKPLEYSETQARNRVSRIISKIESGEIKLRYDSEHGYLRSLLNQLEIPESSQVLVFSKTSMQVQHISPRNPRAIYFNDDTYLGWIRGSSLVEISTDDPKLGAAFYTVEMLSARPRIRQETHQCLGCHSSSLTQGVPGHTVRSGYSDYDGNFDAQRESFVTDDTSPFGQRWGGWYVTGEHGNMQHMGNAYLRGGSLDTLHNSNLQSLEDLFDTAGYLSPLSDIQALMVLEHQTQMNNTLTRADFSARVLQHAGPAREEAERTIQLQWIAKQVVDRLLFCNEFCLTAPVSGKSGFGSEFMAYGPKDPLGRSLREFDMNTRMFKYPLSYLIYSDAFDTLQPGLRQEVCRQLGEVLRGNNQAEEYRHLTPDLRRQISAIVKATKPEILE